MTDPFQGKGCLQEKSTKARREHEPTTEPLNAIEIAVFEKCQKLLDGNTKLLLNIKRIKAENEELRRTKNLWEEKCKTVQKSKDEKRNRELKLEQMGASEKAKANEIQALQEEKKGIRRQLKVEQNKVAAAEKALKTKECETDELVRQIGMMTIEKVKMQSQLEGVKERLSLEQSARAAAEKEAKKLTNQVEFMNKQLRYEQVLRKAAEDKLTVSKYKQAQLSKFFQQIVGAGDTFLRSRQERQQAEQVRRMAMEEVEVNAKQGVPHMLRPHGLEATSLQAVQPRIPQQVKRNKLRIQPDYFVHLFTSDFIGVAPSFLFRC